MTRPCRRITRHLSQIGLTLGLTFTSLLILFSYGGGGLLVAVDDAAPGQVVGGKLHDDPVLGQDADVVLPHLAADVGKHLMTVLQLNAEHRIGQGLDHAALDLDGAVFLAHILTDSCVVDLAVGQPEPTAQREPTERKIQDWTRTSRRENRTRGLRYPLGMRFAKMAPEIWADKTHR